jgi:hypothetical protein
MENKMSFLKRDAWLPILLVILFALIAASFFVPRTPVPVAESVSSSPAASSVAVPDERAVTYIPLASPASNANAEFSGLAWYGDYLILLPQYPNRFGAGDGALFAIPKADILAFLDGKSKDAVKPRVIPFKAPGLTQQVGGFEGYESIGFMGDQIFLTIESKPNKMLGNLVKGKIAPDLSGIEIDATTRLQIPPQADITNLSDETLVVAQDKLLTMYEANGAVVNPKPVAHAFDFKPVSLGTIPFPNIEYRITDATPTDDANKFWAMNYFFPGDTKLLAINEAIAVKFGKGKTHAQYPQVERLVEFQYNANGIALTDTPPIQLVLPNTDARNWEGIARLDNRGFLMVTDSFPQTILGFVAK